MKNIIIPLIPCFFFAFAMWHDMQAGQTLSEDDREKIIVNLCHLLFIKKNTPSDKDRLHYLSKKIQANIRFIKGRKLTWDELKYTIINKPKGKKTFTLFGYGSLINIKGNFELTNTKDYVPALLFGYKRVFHLDHPVPEISIIGLPAAQHSRESARLDVFPTYNQSDIINGVIFEVDLRDFEKIRKRESAYNIHECLVINYSQAMDPNNRFPTFESAYVLSLPEDLPIRNHPEVLPHIVYLYNLLKGGEYWEHQETAIGGGKKSLYPGFVDLLAETSFLVDQKTTIYQWIKKQEAYKNIFLPQLFVSDAILFPSSEIMRIMSDTFYQK